MTTRAQIASLIDHTLLKPEATTAQVDALVAEAAALGTYSVCVSPSLLPLSLPDGLHLATVCGFPSGAHATVVKAAEAAEAAAKGAEYSFGCPKLGKLRRSFRRCRGAGPQRTCGQLSC